MHWTKWPYWLRGGVIGGGVAILSAALSDVCANIFSESLNLVCLLFVLPWIPFWYLPITLLPTTIFSIIGIVTWFIVGALAGSVFDSIKKKKSSSV